MLTDTPKSAAPHKNNHQLPPVRQAATVAALKEGSLKTLVHDQGDYQPWMRSAGCTLVALHYLGCFCCRRLEVMFAGGTRGSSKHMQICEPRSKLHGSARRVVKCSFARKHREGFFRAKPRDLLGETCPDKLLGELAHRTCPESLPQSNLHRAKCAEQLAQSDLR